MKRKNPGSSSMPNASFDLTPLLDVIFICLFVVIIGYTKISAMAEQEAGEAAAANRELQAENDRLSQANGELEARTAELEGQVEALQEQNFDAAAREQAYKEAAEDLQRDVIGTKVMVMTISCTYNPADPEKRKITIITPDRSYDAIEIRRDNEESAFKQLSGHMEKYIQLHDKEEEIVVFGLNTENILVRDKESVTKIINTMKEKYKNKAF